ncbi:MAG: M3 family oligoendopeptidase [Alphaproteobacteria bacterium]
MENVLQGFIDLPTWNLTDLYNGSADPKINHDLNTLKKQADEFVTVYTNIFKNEFTGEQLLSAIKFYENINEGIGKLMTFAGLQYYGDLNNPDFSSLYQNLQEKVSMLAAELVFFNIDLAKLSDESINNALKSAPELLHYRHWLSVLRKYQPHQLSEELEKYALEKSLTGRNAWVRLYDETLASLSLSYDDESLPLEAVVHKMGDKNADVRKKAALTLNEGLSTQMPLFTTITNVLAKDKEIDDKWRHFATSDSSRHLDNQIEPEVVQALATCVRENYASLSHRYYAIKAKMLGFDRLEYWDRNAPLPFDDDADISWPVARKIVLDAYASFSPTISEIASEFFDKNWIDAPTRVGKTSGAFSHPAVPSVHPYILLNYQGRRRDVMTLAHELGHGVHQMLSRGQGYLLADTPLTLAETASVFGEMLTFQHLLGTCETKEQRKSLLAGKIDDMLNTVVRQIAFYYFEQQVHQARRHGELTADDLASIWKRTQEEALGNAVHIDPATHSFWAYISHFIHSPFYVYAYAFGDCLVNSLYAFYQENNDGFADKYIELLKAGGSKGYNDLLQPFGLDLKKPTFWQGGLQMIASLIDELEELC